jgi:hypothetical protein
MKIYGLKQIETIAWNIWNGVIQWIGSSGKIQTVGNWLGV